MGLKDFLSSTIYRSEVLSITACFRTRKQSSCEIIAERILSIIIIGKERLGDLMSLIEVIYLHFSKSRDSSLRQLTKDANVLILVFTPYF